MKTIPLTQGKVAYCDDEDYSFLSRFKWHAARQGDGGRKWYALTNITDPKTGKQTKVRMHHLLLGCPLGRLMWDHGDGNGLNNRRGNLRLVTNGQNQWNAGKRKGTSPYKWVSWWAKRGCWRVAVMAHGRTHFGGYFEDPLAAAWAANTLARKLHGPFVRLNNV